VPIFERALSTGFGTTCVIDAARSLYCWGDLLSEIGVGNCDAPRAAVLVAPAAAWRHVDHENHHVCGVQNDGTLWCWGANTDGQLGLGDFSPRSTPEQVGSTRLWAHVSAGVAHTCAIAQDGSLWCWGRNDHHAVAPVALTAFELPERVGQDYDWRFVAAGNGVTCALRSDQSAWCWGDGTDGRTGTGTTSGDVLAPTQVLPGTTWRSLSAGYQVCGIQSDQSLHCWGTNHNGQLGVGDELPRHEPTRVGTDGDWLSVSVGRTASCGLRDGGALYCWGNSGTWDPHGADIHHTAPQPTDAAASYDQAMLGHRHLCVTSGARIGCSGRNDFCQVSSDAFPGEVIAPFRDVMLP
jgi:alpha-tubulin suppressor-like RCC1 family protein